MSAVETLRSAARLMRERMDAPGLPSCDVRFVLAVADWLDDAAEHQAMHEQIKAEQPKGTGQWVPDQPRILASGLAVARAYLEGA